MTAITVAIWDENTLGEKQERARLRLVSQTLSARELIEERVRQEVDQYNRSEPEIFRGLVQPEGAEVALNGFRMPGKKKIDLRAQIRKALKGFETNRIILLVDDRQLDELEETVTLHEDSSVTFLKLVPLVGG